MIDEKKLAFKSLNEIMHVPEVEKLETALQIFNKEFSKLQTEIATREAKSNEKDFEEVTQRINELQAQKSRLTDKIHENIGNKEPYDDLLAEITTVIDQIKSLDIVIKSFERKSQYPENEAVINQAKIAFNLGVEVIKAGKEFNTALGQLDQRMQIAINALKAYRSKISSLSMRPSIEEQFIIKSFAHTVPDQAAALTWEQLRIMAFDEIKKRIYSK